MIAAAATYQVARASPGASVEVSKTGPVDLFLHNAMVLAVWLAGVASLGLLSIALCVVASVMSGLAIGSAIQTHGISALGYLGHAVVELPALAVALWLAVRPVGQLWAARVGQRRARPASLLEQVGRSALWLTAAALVLLTIAALWESVVVPPW